MLMNARKVREQEVEEFFERQRQEREPRYPLLKDRKTRWS